MNQLALRPSTALGHEPWREAEWQRLWLAMQERSWRSLALVPAGPGPADLTLEIAMNLARTGMRHIREQIHVADACQIGFDSAMDFTAQVRHAMQTGPVIMALAPISASPVSIPLAQAADGALLCVVLNQTRIADAERTKTEIGPRHFIGAITVR